MQNNTFGGLTESRKTDRTIPKTFNPDRAPQLSPLKQIATGPFSSEDECIFDYQ